MAKDPAALLYIDNWLVSTKEMKADERGWYLNLILHQYDKGDLPNDIEELANLADVRISEYELFKQKWEQVLKHKFQQNSFGRLENAIAKDILKKRESFKAKRSDAGKWGYIVKFANNNFKITHAQLEYIKENIELDKIDTKNEQVLKQMLEQKIKLYINGDGDVNKDIDKDIKANVITWRDSFDVYLSELNSVYQALITDKDFILQRERYATNVDIVLSLEKAYNDFWGKEKGWRYKKRTRTKVIDWKETLTKAIDFNKVYKPFAKRDNVPQEGVLKFNTPTQDNPETFEEI